MKVKTEDLSGAALDWAVAKCEVGDAINEIDDPHFYSTDWAEGGPIIEREGISLECDEFARWHANGGWSSDTPLLSAMRCYVAMKMGEEVEVPDELVKPKEVTLVDEALDQLQEDVRMGDLTAIAELLGKVEPRYLKGYLGVKLHTV